MRKRIFHLILIAMIAPFSIFGQSEFDKGLERLTDALSKKLESKKNLKLAVWDLTNLNGEVSPIGKYIAEDVSVNLSGIFSVANRNQLATLLKEERLRKGFNQTTLREIKQLSDVDILITGTVSVLSGNIKVTLQALDADANIVAAAKGEIPMNSDVKELLGINNAESNRGFNHSLSSNEQNNNPRTVNSDCQLKHTGDFCFANMRNEKIKVHIRNSKTRNAITLEKGQSQCFYNLEVGVYQYTIKHQQYTRGFSDGYQEVTYGSGQIKVDECQSKTFNVK